MVVAMRCWWHVGANRRGLRPLKSRKLCSQLISFHPATLAHFLAFLIHGDVRFSPLFVVLPCVASPLVEKVCGKQSRSKVGGWLGHWRMTTVYSMSNVSPSDLLLVLLLLLFLLFLLSSELFMANTVLG